MTGDRYLPIEDYAFLSDCRSSALVSRNGSIDWACLGRFDTGSSFGRLLDADRGGQFRFGPDPDDTAEVDRAYREGSLVLDTTLRTLHGVCRRTDLLVPVELCSDPGAVLVRRIECLEGSVDVRTEIVPRFDYGATRPWLRAHDGRSVEALGGDDAVIVSTDFDLELDHDATSISGSVSLAAGESACIVLSARPAYVREHPAVSVDDAEELIERSSAWWSTWSADTTSSGRNGELVARSAVVLKGLTCADSGSVVAAPTTSLPEVPGGTANWDYRYSWVRDSHVALQALVDVGHFDEADAFRDFIIRSAAGHAEELQIMFGPYGERSLTERQLDLEGWRGAAPVRTGNAAAGQTQLDVYGHLLESAVMWHAHGSGIDQDEWRFLEAVVDLAADRRHEQDAGIWELRGAPRDYVHSKVMVWVALDRGIRLVDEFGFDSTASDRWREARDSLRHEIETRGVDPDRGNFVQYYGSVELDASLLKLPLVGFVDADDERMVATTDAIMRELAVPPNGFLRRCRDTGNGGTEGVFLLCSFWLVEVLTMQGRLEEARSLIDRLLDTGNDLGLFSEEWNPADETMLGNFPQAFTHLGLISAVKRLDDAGRAADKA